jgi:flagellin
MASFSVVSNIAAANSQANLRVSQVGLQTSLSRLSSGYRINQSGDDAAGLAVANTHRQTIVNLNQGIRNANDGLSQLQIKDGALANISTLLDRLETLATQASSASNGVDLATLSAEFEEVTKEIDREAAVADIVTDDAAFSVFISTESTTSDGHISAEIDSVKVSDLGITTVTFDSVTEAQDALKQVETALSNLSSVQGTVGSLQNKLQFAISLAQAQVVNTQAAESRIRDANIAEESANMTRYNILTQSGIAALAQANQATSSVLGLLR